MLFPHLDTPVRVTGVSVRIVEDGSKVFRKPEKFKADNKHKCMHSFSSVSVNGAADGRFTSPSS